MLINNELFPFCDLKLGDALSADKIFVTYRIHSAIDRGHQIDTHDDIRNSLLFSLYGPIRLPLPKFNEGAIKKFIGQAVCRHPDKGLREQLLDLFEINQSYIAEGLGRLSAEHPFFVEACLQFDFPQAQIEARTLDLPEEDAELADTLIAECKKVAHAFDAQRMAAFAYRMIRLPFDGALGETKNKLYASVGAVTRHIDAYYDIGERAYEDFNNPNRATSRRKYRSLDKVGLGFLRAKKNEKYILSLMPAEKIACLPQTLAHLREEARLRRSIIHDATKQEGEMEGQSSAGKSLDSILLPVCGRIMLAMRCAHIAEAMWGTSGECPEEPPEWLMSPNAYTGEAKDSLHHDDSGNPRASSRGNFRRMLSLFRHHFLEDGRGRAGICQAGAKSLEEWDEEENIEQGRYAKDIIQRMRIAANQGLWNCDPSSSQKIRNYAEHYGWKSGSNPN